MEAGGRVRVRWLLPRWLEARFLPVEITNYFVEAETAVFEGTVTSPAAKCAGKGRKVKVVGYDEVGGAKRTLGKDETNAQGKFTVREPIPFFETSPNAKVTANKDCKGDRSKLTT